MDLRLITKEQSDGSKKYDLQVVEGSYEGEVIITFHPVDYRCAKILIEILGSTTNDITSVAWNAS